MRETWQCHHSILKWRAWFVVLIFGFSIFASGCEPLRKKFVRQKKKDKEENVNPVLDPVDYPEMAASPDKFYKYHYSMWQVYHRDLLTALEDHVHQKRLLYMVEQMRTQMEEMQKYVNVEKRKFFQQYISKTQSIERNIASPLKKDVYRLRKKVKLLGKEVRNNCKFKNIEEDIIPKREPQS